MQNADKPVLTITPKGSSSLFNLKEIWDYRDLLSLFVKRNIVTLYKQTILGPLWFVVQPLITSVVFTLLFNRIGSIDTDSVPPFLFNLAGLTLWGYFAGNLIETSDAFKKNEHIFSKVYFPRVVLPMSIVVSNLLKFFIQFVILCIMFVYFSLQSGSIQVGWGLLIIPVVLLATMLTSLGLGLAISSFTTRYRDLVFLVQFGVQLLMFLSAVMYPLSLANEKVPGFAAKFISFNPIALSMETFRNALFQGGDYSLNGFAIVYPLLMSFALFFIGLLLFNKTERNFVDTI